MLALYFVLIHQICPGDVYASAPNVIPTYHILNTITISHTIEHPICSIEMNDFNLIQLGALVMVSYYKLDDTVNNESVAETNLKYFFGKNWKNYLQIQQNSFPHETLKSNVVHFVDRRTDEIIHIFVIRGTQPNIDKVIDIEFWYCSFSIVFNPFYLLEDSYPYYTRYWMNKIFLLRLSLTKTFL
jgi:hypothetical protein